MRSRHAAYQPPTSADKAPPRRRGTRQPGGRGYVRRAERQRQRSGHNLWINIMAIMLGLNGLIFTLVGLFSLGNSPSTLDLVMLGFGTYTLVASGLLAAHRKAGIYLSYPLAALMVLGFPIGTFIGVMFFLRSGACLRYYR